MQIRIRSDMKSKVADAVGCCVFTALRENDRDATGIRSIDEGCLCYRAIKSAEPDGENVIVDMSDSYCVTLASLIEKYISVAASEQADNDMEWLCEMMSLYHQLKASEAADTQRDHETEQEMMNRQSDEEEIAADGEYYEDISF